MKSEISYALVRNPFENLEISRVIYTSGKEGPQRPSLNKKEMKIDFLKIGVLFLFDNVSHIIRLKLSFSESSIFK